jgi:HK97 gp10 family phage protein
MIDVDISELTTLAYDLDGAPTRVLVAAGKVVRVTAYQIEATSKTLCPVDTGYLRSSISTDVAASYLEAEIGPTAAYGAYIEMGTSRMAPQAYMGPAADRHDPDFMAGMAAAAGHALP